VATKRVEGATGNFTVDQTACEDLMMHEPQLAVYLDEELRMLLAYTQSNTPVNTGKSGLVESLNYIRSLPDPARKTQGGSVYSTSMIWNLIEWGSIHNEPYRPLSSAAIALGLDFHEVDQEI
jgi:hypothetical protein